MSSGTPMATASDTPEWAYSAFSTSVDATYRTCVSGIPNDTTSLASLTFSPPRIIMSFTVKKEGEL
jgi:hypothetical protein